MTSAWDRFEAALDRRDVARLRAVAASLDVETTGTELDRQELRAVIFAVLASESEMSLSSASEAVADAAQAGRGEWPYYYLAEAAARIGDDDAVLDAVSQIDPTYFISRDLRWRQARCQELSAIANVRLGRWDAAEEVVVQLLADYVAYSDTDDYASPQELVRVLLDSGDAGRELLRQLSMSVDLNEWLDRGLRERVEAVVGNP